MREQLPDSGLYVDIYDILNDFPRTVNIIVVSEGFAEEERDKFRQFCDELTKRIDDESWFSSKKFPGSRENLSIRSVFLPTIDSIGQTLGVPAGWPTSDLPTVMFNTRYEENSGTHWLYGKQAPLLNEIIAVAGPTGQPYINGTVALLNYSTPGALTIGQTAWCSTFPDFHKLLFHEFGHLCGLSEEYSAPEGTTAKGTVEGLNVSSWLDNLPWEDFISANARDDGSPWPTVANAKPACSQTVAASNSWNFVGAFEGGAVQHCGVYRPSANCRMNDWRRAFCKVCRHVIAEYLDPTLTDINRR